MVAFKSLNDLIWRLQNNGGGEINIKISPIIGQGNGLASIQLELTLTNCDKVTGQGNFIREAVADLSKNV